MATLGRDKLGGEFRFETVDVPEWGGEVRCRSWTGRERDIHSMRYGNRNGDITGYVAGMLALTVCDDAGELVYDVDNQADIAAIDAWDAEIRDRVFEVANRLAGYGKKAVESAEKN